jgi:3-hydroxyisobutyrate dehydrogenase
MGRMAKDIALLGTGIIGSGMAGQLLDAGHRLSVWNRTTKKARPFEQRGAKVTLTAIEAVDGADFVLTVLADGHAVRDVMLVENGALEGMGRDSVWLQMSTVGLDEPEEFDRLAQRSGVHFVDAPVLGTREPAEGGQLTVLVAGSSRIIERCQPIFDAVGQRTMRIDKPCDATRLKLVINNWVIGLMGVLAETFTTAEALGVRPQLFLEAISGGALDAGYAQIKGQMMQQGEFEPSFALRLALKDARLIEQAANKYGFEPRIIATVAEYFQKALKDGHGDKDMSAVVCAMRKR